MQFLRITTSSAKRSISLNQSHSPLSDDFGAMVDLARKSPGTPSNHLNALHFKTDSNSFLSQISELSGCEPADPRNAPHRVVNTHYNEGNILQQNGYKKVRKLCDTQQGELIEAISIESGDKTAEKVIIKKVSRKAHTEQTTYVDEKCTDDEMTYCIPKNVLKEALILSHLTVDNQSICNYIVELIHFFHCDKFFYVVLEHVDHNTINLKEFAEKSLNFIREGKLEMKQYLKVIKFIFWQIFVLIQWMHNNMNCCHLDLKLEHILLKGVDFITDPKSGKIINLGANISIKVCDFGSAELFKYGNFECDKEVSPLDEIQYKSPQILNGEIYDAQKADIWALGMMLVHCVIGRPLYETVYDAGFISLQRGTLQRYLKSCNLKKNMKNMKKGMLNLVKNMLNMDEDKRYSILDVLKHKSFEAYYSKYKARIESKARSQETKLIQERNKLKHFPFYQIIYQ